MGDSAGGIINSERFRDDLSDLTFQSQCARCAHKRLGKTSCKAFDNIPVIILIGEFDHTQPFPGDRGIQFKELR